MVDVRHTRPRQRRSRKKADNADNNRPTASDLIREHRIHDTRFGKYGVNPNTDEASINSAKSAISLAFTTDKDLDIVKVLKIAGKYVNTFSADIRTTIREYANSIGINTTITYPIHDIEYYKAEDKTIEFIKIYPIDNFSLPYNSPKNTRHVCQWPVGEFFNPINPSDNFCCGWQVAPPVYNDDGSTNLEPRYCEAHLRMSVAKTNPSKTARYHGPSSRRLNTSLKGRKHKATSLFSE